MKQFLLFLLLIIQHISTNAQNFDETIKLGDKAFTDTQYKKAINIYLAAAVMEGSKKEIVKAKVNKVFDRIDKLREEAQLAKKRALTERDKAGEAKMETEAALEKTEKILANFYFYKDRFALAYKNNFYYFIDKEGFKIPKLGEWRKAEQFEESTGFAKVYILEYTTLVDHIIDTSGNLYRAKSDIDDIRKDEPGTNDEPIQALDLSLEQEDNFAGQILSHKSLQVLILKSHPSDAKVNIDSLIARIAELQSLKNLQLIACKLKSLPVQICELEGLSVLNLVGNLFQNLPIQIAQLKDLTVLNLSRNKLRDLPSQIGELKYLISLELSENHLMSLPTQVGDLENLSLLSLSVNALEDLPTQIGELKNLTSLYLDNNFLSSLPAQIGELENLTELNLYNNWVDSLPAQIGKLKNLRNLDLGSNHLKRLPVQIGGLINLADLSLNDNKIEHLPDQFGELINLKSLSLSRNKLKKLPATMGKLQNLAVLLLSSNQFSSLPDWIGELKNLRMLLLDGNQISDAEEKKIRKLLPNCSIIF